MSGPSTSSSPSTQAPPTSLPQLESQLSSLKLLSTQYDALATSLKPVLEARKAGNGRMELGVDVGMGWGMEGIVDDTSTIRVFSFEAASASSPPATEGAKWVDLPIEEALVFVDAQKKLVDAKVEEVEKEVKKMEEGKKMLSEVLRKALAGVDGEEGEAK